MGRSRLAIVVPVRNEEKTIKKVIISLKKYGDILIVDDSSTDKTSIIIQNLPIKFIKNKINLGYEGTVLKGIKYLLKKNYKYIATFDADGEHDPKFLQNIKKIKNFDLLIGKRKKFNRFSEYFFSFFIRLFFNIHDPLSGLRVYSTNILKKIKLINENDFNTYLIFKIKNNNGRIIHKPLNVKKRKDNSRLGDNFKVSLNIFISLFKVILKIMIYKINKYYKYNLKKI